MVLVFGIYLDTNLLLRKWSREKFTKLNARLCQTSLLSLFFNNLLLKGVDEIIPYFFYNVFVLQICKIRITVRIESFYPHDLNVYAIHFYTEQQFCFWQHTSIWNYILLQMLLYNVPHVYIYEQWTFILIMTIIMELM